MDRLDYVSMLSNETAYCEAVEGSSQQHGHVIMSIAISISLICIMTSGGHLRMWYLGVLHDLHLRLSGSLDPRGLGCHHDTEQEDAYAMQRSLSLLLC